MLRKTAYACVGVMMAMALVSASGCATGGTGPNLGLLSYPIPVSPYFQKSLEDKWWNQKRYEKAPILGPITPSSPAIALDEPSDDEVMRALEDARGVQGGWPFLWERQRNNVRITKDLVADYVDPPRVYPLVGPAQLHHAQYKCTVYFNEVTRVGWPVPYTTVNDDAEEVLYIDHNHLHMVGNADCGVGSNYNQ